MAGAPVAAAAAAAAVAAVVLMLDGTAAAQAPSDGVLDGRRLRLAMMFFQSLAQLLMISRVRAINWRAVLITSTLFWYEREAAIISTISVISFTLER